MNAFFRQTNYASSGVQPIQVVGPGEWLVVRTQGIDGTVSFDGRAEQYPFRSNQPIYPPGGYFALATVTPSSTVQAAVLIGIGAGPYLYPQEDTPSAKDVQLLPIAYLIEKSGAEFPITDFNLPQRFLETYGVELDWSGNTYLSTIPEGGSAPAGVCPYPFWVGHILTGEFEGNPLPVLPVVNLWNASFLRQNAVTPAPGILDHDVKALYFRLIPAPETNVLYPGPFVVAAFVGHKVTRGQPLTPLA